jgi:hypothetical protein
MSHMLTLALPDTRHPRRLDSVVCVRSSLFTCSVGKRLSARILVGAAPWFLLGFLLRVAMNSFDGFYRLVVGAGTVRFGWVGVGGVCGLSGGVWGDDAALK